MAEKSMSLDFSGKHYIDIASVGTAIATVSGWLPSIAALFSIVWSVVSTYIAVQRWLRDKRGDA
jgi:hypothetical protein